MKNLERDRSVFKSPLATGSVEEWYVQKLRIPGSPCRDGRFSDKLVWW